MRMYSYIVSFVSCWLSLSSLFLQRSQALHSSYPCKSLSPTRGLWGSFEYEYIPPDKADETTVDTNADHSHALFSTYPAGTPAGLRGEAVRSALRSGQSVGWMLNRNSNNNNNQKILPFGVVQASGAGVLEFCNNKFSRSFAAPAASSGDSFVSVGTFQQACWLTAQGRLMDRLGVAVTDSETAFFLTSPGHSSTSLFQHLDPFIFPLDRVTLKDWSSSLSCIFSLSSIRKEHVQTTVDSYIWPLLQEHIRLVPSRSDVTDTIQLPAQGACLLIPLQENNNHDSSTNNSMLMVFPTSGLPECAVHGYTFVFLGHGSAVGQRIWDHAVSDANPTGPVAVGAREFESLRIESGQAAFGYEITALQQADAKKKKKTSPNSNEASDSTITTTKAKPGDQTADKTTTTTPATPLELHLLETTIDTNKGCYLGQEGIASSLKNPRGPPRTLYQVVFEDEFNPYDGGDSRSKTVSNKTRQPIPGDELLVLGSNQEISAGILTSLAEPGSTGARETLGLALIRRADSILKQMKDRHLEISSSFSSELNVAKNSGMIAPPPMDPLDGLEVIVRGSFTVGRLRAVPSRRLRRGQILYDQDDLSTDYDDVEEDSSIMAWNIPPQPLSETVAPGTADRVDDDESDIKAALEEVAKAEAEAEAAAAEAKRKAEKMEQLRKRAEEAMARRKQNTRQA